MRAPSPSHSAVGSCLPSRIDVQDALSASGCASQQRSACPWQVTMLIATFTIFVFGGSITSVAKYYDVLEPKTKVCAYPLEASAIRRGPSAEVPQPRSLSIFGGRGCPQRHILALALALSVSRRNPRRRPPKTATPRTTTSSTF